MAKVLCMKGKLVLEVEDVQVASNETGISAVYIKHLIKTGNEKDGWTFDYIMEKKKQVVPLLTIKQFKVI